MRRYSPLLCLLPSVLLLACRFPIVDPSALSTDDARLGEASLAETGPGTRWRVVGLPFANSLVAVWGKRRDDVWAVGTSGRIAHYDGERWSAVASPTTSSLRGLWGSGDEVWAVGDQGTILRARSGTWSAEASPTSANLNGVWGSSASDIWAVGEGGLILHHDGSAWSSETRGTSALLAVWGSAPGTLWAATESGTLLRHQGPGAAWTEVPSVSERSLRALWGRSDDLLWAAGAGGVIVEGTSGSWIRRLLPEEITFRGLAGVPDGAAGTGVWAAGDQAGEGVIATLEGGSWRLTGSFPSLGLRAIWMDPSGEGWAVGGGGKVLHHVP